MLNSTKLPRLSKPASSVKATNLSDKGKLSEIVYPKFEKKSEIKDISKDKFKRNINLVKQSVPYKNSFSTTSPLVNAKRIRTTETPIAIRNLKVQNTFKVPTELPKLDAKKSLNFAKSDVFQFNSRITISESKPSDKLSSNPFSVAKTKLSNSRNSQFPANSNNNSNESANQIYAESLGNILQFKESLSKTIDRTDTMIDKIDTLIDEISKLVSQKPAELQQQ